MSAYACKAVLVTKAWPSVKVRACLAVCCVDDTSRLSNDLDVLSGRRKSLIYKRKRQSVQHVQQKPSCAHACAGAGGRVRRQAGAHTRTRRAHLDILDIFKKINIEQQVTTSRCASRCSTNLDGATTC
jgi:hypothetical protein